MLEQTEFDVIVLGTSLTNSIMAAALAKTGKTILHIDHRSYYGGNSPSFNYKDFCDFLTSKNFPPQSSNVSHKNKNWEKLVGNIKCDFIPLSSQFLDPICNASFLNNDLTGSDSDKEDFNLEKISRKFIIDVDPRLILCYGNVIDLILISNISRYLECRGIEKIYFQPEKEKLKQVPCTKSEVFTSLLQPEEKRSLMAFLRLAMGNTRSLNPDGPQDILESKGDFNSFSEYLQSYSLTDNIIPLVSYALARIKHDSESETSIHNKDEYLNNIKSFCSSLGRFYSGAYLYLLYGSCELTQAFCRLCAVNGGVYILRCEPESIVIKDGQCIGLIIHNSNINSSDSNNNNKKNINNSQFIKCKWIVIDSVYLDNSFFEFQDEELTCLYQLNIVSESLTEKQENSIIHIPPRIFDNSNPIIITQYDFTTGMCPKGKYLIYSTTIKKTDKKEGSKNKHVREKIKNDLNGVTEYISRTLNEKEKKGHIIFSSFWERIYRKFIGHLPDGILLTKQAKPDLCFDSESISQIEQLFQIIVPNEKMFATKNENLSEKKPLDDMDEFDNLPDL